MGFSIFQWVSFSLIPCLSLNALIPTWVTNIGRNGKTDVKLLFPHLHATCHGQFNPCKLERPCFCRTASLRLALKACEIRGSQRFSTLPAMCLVIKYHIITSIRLTTASYSWKTEKRSLPFWRLHMHFGIPHEGFCQVTVIKQKKMKHLSFWKRISTPPPFSFFFSIFFCCCCCRSYWLIQLRGYKFQWH